MWVSLLFDIEFSVIQPETKPFSIWAYMLNCHTSAKHTKWQLIVLAAGDVKATTPVQITLCFRVVLYQQSAFLCCSVPVISENN